jgi:metallo-beta-lactamase family protein
MIVIAGSGMATGGRVLHHLAHGLGDPRSTVLLVGFQAAGTRGRLLQEGARSVRIHGQDVAVRAQVTTVHGLSAHGDVNDIQRWLDGFTAPPAMTWVVHGEPSSAAALAETIQGRGWRAAVAVDGSTVRLGATLAQAASA